jgi:hypothetical protein
MRQGLVGVVDAAILAARAMPQPDPSDFVLGVIPQISVLQGAAAVSATPAATVLSRGRDQEGESQRLQVSLLLGLRLTSGRACICVAFVCSCVHMRLPSLETYPTARSCSTPPTELTPQSSRSCRHSRVFKNK